MTETNSASQNPMTLESWVAARLGQLRSSELWLLHLEPGAIESLLSGDKAVIHGQAKRNRDGRLEEVPLTIQGLSAETWQIQFPDGLRDVDVLGLVAANFSIPAFPTLETEKRLPELAREIRLRHQREPKASGPIPRQLAAAGEELTGAETQAADHPCHLKMDERTGEYRVTSSTQGWVFLELECLGRDGETLIQRRIHHLAPNLQTSEVKFTARGRFDKERLKREAESDRVTLRLRSLDHHDLPFLTPDQKHEFLADRAHEMQILPASEETPEGVVCRVKETQTPGFCDEQQLQWFLHVTPTRSAASKVREEAKPPGKKPLTEQQLLWDEVIQREYGSLLGTAMICTRGNRDKAEELVQEVLLKFLKKYPDVRTLEPKQLHNHLQQAVRNRVIDAWRLKGNHQVQFALDEQGVSAEMQLPAAEDAPNSRTGNAIDIGEVMDNLLDWQEELVQQLPHPDEKTHKDLVDLVEDIELMLLVLMGYARLEIAWILGISLGSYDHRFRRAKTSLREKLPAGLAEQLAK